MLIVMGPTLRVIGNDIIVSCSYDKSTVFMQIFVVKKRVHIVFAMWHMVQCMLMNIVQHFKLTNVVQQMLNSLL